MITLDLTGKSSGRIWSRKPNPSANEGIICTICNTGNGIKSGKRHRFLKASFIHGAPKLIAGDHLGSVYVFDIVENRFSVIQNTGQACTCIATGLQTSSEYIIALADTSLKCYSSESKELISWMRGHETAVHTISLNDAGNTAITTSQDTAQLWDVDTFERKRKLNVMMSVGIRKVFFIPSTNLIMTCFKDNTIFAWDSDTLEWRYQLKCTQADPIDYKSFAIAKNGKTLVAAGKSSILHVYSLETLRIIRIVQMPEYISAVKDISFLPENFDNGANKILGVLSQDGYTQFIDINTCRLMWEILSPWNDDKISSFVVDPNGHYIVCITVGGSLVFYNVSALCADFNKPPGPLVKVVGDIWKSKLSNATEKAEYGDDTAMNEKSATMNLSKRPANASLSTGRMYKKYLTEDLSESKDALPNGLSKVRLMKVLRGYGSYPEQYRMFIWRSMLQLPENTQAFSALVKKGVHISYTSLLDKYPLKSRRLQRAMQKILSALAHWSPIFAEHDSLPGVVFPFVKLFQNNHLVCFEMVVTLLMNWSQHWFEFFPNPPLGILGVIENVLSCRDKKLLHHFIKFKVTTQHYAWPLLQTLFTEVFTRAEWLKFFDHVFSNKPMFLTYAVIAYCITCRGVLLRTESGDDIKFFFHNRNSVDLNAIIRETYHLMDCTPENDQMQSVAEEFKPLPKGVAYPVFNKYPEFIVDYQAKEREKIKQDEIEYLREKKVTEELARELAGRRLDDEAWYQKQEMLLDAEEKRRKILQDENEKLSSQRIRLGAMKRELRVKELQLLDAARSRFVQHQQMRKETALKRLEEEIYRTARTREHETAAAVEDVEIEGLQLEAQRVKLEQKMAEHEAEMELVNEGRTNDYRHQETAESRLYQRLRQKQTDAELTAARKLEEQIGKKEIDKQSAEQQSGVARQYVLDVKRRENDLERVVSSNCDYRRKQLDINNKLHDLLDAKDTELEEAKKRLIDLEQELVKAQTERVRIMELEKANVSNYRRDLDSFPDRREAPSTRDLSSRFQPGSTQVDDRSAASSSIFTTERGRGTFDEREKQLMGEVRDLRQRLVSERARRDPPPSYLQA